MYSVWCYHEAANCANCLVSMSKLYLSSWLWKAPWILINCNVHIQCTCMDNAWVLSFMHVVVVLMWGEMGNKLDQILITFRVAQQYPISLYVYHLIQLQSRTLLFHRVPMEKSLTHVGQPAPSHVTTTSIHPSAALSSVWLAVFVLMARWSLATPVYHRPAVLVSLSTNIVSS